jgi:hypothetical protein
MLFEIKSTLGYLYGHILGHAEGVNGEHHRLGREKVGLTPVSVPQALSLLIAVPVC